MSSMSVPHLQQELNGVGFERPTMAIGSVALSLVSLALAWSPMVAHLAFLASIVALVMGALATRDAAVGRARGLGLGIVGSVVATAALAVVVAGEAVFTVPSILG